MEPTPAQKWQHQLHERAEQMGSFVMLLGNLDKPDGGSEDEDESDDDEPSIEKLEAMTRLFLPKKAEEYLQSVSSTSNQPRWLPASGCDLPPALFLCPDMFRSPFFSCAHGSASLKAGLMCRCFYSSHIMVAFKM